MALGMHTLVLFLSLDILASFSLRTRSDALSLTLEHPMLYRRDPRTRTAESVVPPQQLYIFRVRNRGGRIYSPQVILFTAQFISRIGGSLRYTLGVSHMEDNTKKSKTAAYKDAFYKLTPAQTTYSQMVGSVVVRLDNPSSSSFHFLHFFWHSFRRLSQKLQSENNYSRNKFPKLIRNKNFLRLSQVRTLLTSRFLESLFADMLTFFRLSCCIISPRFSTPWDTCPTAEVHRDAIPPVSFSI
jgi:hypothetical protein